MESAWADAEKLESVLMGGYEWRSGDCRKAAGRSFVAACCFLSDVCSGEPSRADVACWGGWGPHTPCARQIGPHPPQPTPPSRHGSLRCVWVRRQQCRGSLVPRCIVCPLVPFSACPRIPVQAHTGSHGQGVSRSDNLCSQCAEDGSPLERAQSEVTSARISRAKQRQPESAERSNAPPTRTDQQPDRQTAGQAVMSDASLPP